MKNLYPRLSFLFFIFLVFTTISQAENKSEEQGVQPIQLLVNQVAYNANASKQAILKTPFNTKALPFKVLNKQKEEVYSGKTKPAGQVADWSTEFWYSSIDFSGLKESGIYTLQLTVNNETLNSYPFSIGDNILGEIIFPAINEFFEHQKANSPEELGADTAILLYGSNKTVDLHGGWCDASGDVSKYFSHLAYTNFMLPQQTPMVTWSMINTVEKVPAFLEKINTLQTLKEKALYGADYLMRSLSSEGYFYMTVFSYFDKNPKARRVVGLLADSKTTSEYQCAYREGGGMAVAALARISQWKMNSDFTSEEYLNAAERAFAHLQKYSTTYADDGKDNIIDDYCALMGATELWLATTKSVYADEARKRAANLSKRLSTEGYFISNDDNRPFWHAADAGLPIIALVHYLDAEQNSVNRQMALNTIQKAIDYQLEITQNTNNPFGYPRQTFRFQNNLKTGFFIPHENESGWWWQGENARLGSLAAAMIFGGRLVYPAETPLGVKPELEQFSSNITTWILGCNPYNMCMLYGYGKINVPFMASMYGHGSGIGGISNGITGKDGNSDGSGIDFKVEDNGNEWRWSEQWIPHTGWFLQAITALTTE